MKVIALIGGLGSQMFKYAFYLAMKEHTSQRCLVDTTFFEQRESWNGYELKNVFGIDAPDIKSELSENQYCDLKKGEKSYIDICLEYLVNTDDTEYYLLGTKKIYKKKQEVKPKLRKLRQKILYFKIYFGIRYTYQLQDVISDKNAYYNEYAHNSDEHFREYKEIIKSAFKFKEFNDNKNLLIANKMMNEDSVALHIRRTDHMADNVKLFKNKFFEKSVNFIRIRAEGKLSFYVFSDDMEWCKNNIEEIGLRNDDEITFVDWNNGLESYRDMQLMTYCKHNVVPISAFSWWGYYLSDRDNKIVCAPKGYWTEIENHF